MNCNNCQHKIEEGIKFCPNCGQKKKAGKVSLWTYIAEFFNLVFNVEGKLFVTMRDLFVPGKLTVEYFKGRRIIYFHPLRLLIVLAALYISAYHYRFNEILLISIDGSERLINKNALEEITRVEIGKQIDSLNQYNYNMAIYDSIAYDSIEELRCNISDNLKGGVLFKFAFTDIPFNFGENRLSIKGTDIVRLSPEELLEKYKVQGFWSKLILKQATKFLHDFGGILDFLFNNYVLAILLTMPFSAFILKILYYKENKYYVEHLVFFMHTNAFSLLISTIAFLLSYFSKHLYFLLLLLPFIYFLFALKNYYMQSWKWTTFKFFSFSICNAIVGVCLFLLSLVFSFLLF